jgi:hypothetical protein
MKNIDRTVKKSIALNKASAGGETMRVHAVSDPRFSRVKSNVMFPGKTVIHKPEVKETENPNKKVKPLKKMKNPGKKKK